MTFFHFRKCDLIIIILIFVYKPVIITVGILFIPHNCYYNGLYTGAARLGTHYTAIFLPVNV